MIPIVPALIPKSSNHARQVLETLSFSPEVHLDVVDGKFVPFTAWPFEPSGKPEEIKELTDKFTLEVDLMVDNPVEVGREWLEAGADMLVFHVERTTSEEFISFVKKCPVTVSISALNSTPIEEMSPYLEWADGVQLMGIAKIGAQGQSFDESVLERIKWVKNNFPDLPVTIDGSVNELTIARLKEAGADRFICGSAIVSAPDPEGAYRKLKSLIN